MNLKQLLAEKRYGFYVMLAAAVLAIITAIVYAVGYKNDVGHLDWAAFALLLVGGIIAVASAFIRFDEWGTAILALFTLIALLLFVKIIYLYVTVVMVGIDATGAAPEFVSTTVFLALTFVTSIVAVFLPKNKTKEVE